MLCSILYYFVMCACEGAEGDQGENGEIGCKCGRCGPAYTFGGLPGSLCDCLAGATPRGCTPLAIAASKTTAAGHDSPSTARALGCRSFASVAVLSS